MCVFLKSSGHIAMYPCVFYGCMDDGHDCNADICQGKKKNVVLLFLMFFFLWFLFTVLVVQKMKTTDHLRSLIGDLEIYERELQQRVREKEAELERLLRRFAPAALPSSSSSFSSSLGAWKLRITRPAQESTDDREAPSSLSPRITEERRYIRPALACKDTIGGEENSKRGNGHPNTSLSIDISAISSISSASTISADVDCSFAEVRQLLSGDEKTRPTRRVRFASRSPPTGLSAAGDDASVTTKTRPATSENPRGTPLPRVLSSAALPRVVGGGERNTAGTAVGSADCVHAGDGGRSCCVRGLETHEGGEENSAGEVRSKERPGVDSALTRPRPPRRRRCARRGADSSQSPDVSHFVSAKRLRDGGSRSVSAARPHAVSDAQQEGRGAGIVLACGPTLFVD